MTTTSSSSRWQQPVTVAVAAALAAVPVAYLAWKRAERRDQRQQALKLLRKVELIVAEVSVRLLHLANQAEDALANDERRGGADDEVEGSTESTLNSYYHFDSHGNKLKTKWDSYNVDAELQRLEEEEEAQQNGADAGVAAVGAVSVQRKPQYAPIDKTKLLTAVGGIEREFEAVLAFLDDIRGDEHVKQLRKAIALKINEEHFGRIDYVRRILAE